MATGKSSTIDTIINCAHCGALNQHLGSTCEGCGHYLAKPIPSWATRQKRKGLFGRHGLIFMTHRKWILIALFLLVGGAFTWHNYHIVPNPVTLIFSRPSTSISFLSTPGQWAMADANLAHSRYIPNPGVLPKGEVFWSTEEALLSGVSAPIVANGTIYVGSDFKFLALDAATGKVQWDIALAGLVNSTPAVAGDTVYFGSGDSNIWALNRHNGDIEWTFRTGSVTSSSPLVQNGFLFAGSGDGYMYSLDATTGEQLWKFRTSDNVTAPPTLQDGVLFFTSNDNGLYSVNYRTGQAKMLFRTRGTAVFDAPVVANGLVYMVSGNGILTADAGIREIPARWQFEKMWRILWVRGFLVPNPPAQHGTGWRFTPGTKVGFIASGPAVTEDSLYVGDTNGNVYSIDAKDANPNWIFRAEGDIRNSPIVAGDIVYIGTRDGFLYALDRHAGTQIWKLDLGAPISLDIALADGKLIVRTDDGNIHSIQ